MSADGDTIREALDYARFTLGQLWAAGKTNSSIDLDPALAALRRLEDAEEDNGRLRQALDWIESEPEDPVKVQLWARAGLG